MVVKWMWGIHCSSDQWLYSIFIWIHTFIHSIHTHSIHTFKLRYSILIVDNIACYLSTVRWRLFPSISKYSHLMTAYWQYRWHVGCLVICWDLVTAEFCYGGLENQSGWPLNTLRPRQNGRHFADDIFKCIFLNKNVWFPTKITLKFIPKGLINNISALAKI